MKQAFQAQTFWDDLIGILRQQWPDLARVDLFTRSRGGEFRRAAGYGVSDTEPSAPTPGSAAARALAGAAWVEGPPAWAIPLAAGGHVFGALSIEGRSAPPPEFVMLLRTLTAPLGQMAAVLDEMQQLDRFRHTTGQAAAPPLLLDAVYQQFSIAPDELALDAVRETWITEAAITAQGPRVQSVLAGGAALLGDQRQALQDGTPLLFNALKTDTLLSPALRAYFAEHQVQAIGLFPIRQGDQLTHVLSAAYTSSHVFTASEIRLLHRLSDQLGQSIRHWHLTTQAHDLTERLARLGRLLITQRDLTRQINAGLANPELLQSVCRRLVEQAGFDHAALVRFDQVPSAGNVVADYPPRLGVGMLLALDGFAPYQQWQTTTSAVLIESLENAGAVLGPNEARFRSLQVRALLLVPVTVQSSVIGMLVLASRGTFHPEEQDVAQALAGQLGLSWRNAELFAEIQQRANQLERIAAFGRSVTGTFDRDEIYRRVAEVMPKLLPADYVSLALVLPGQRELAVIQLSDSGFSETRLPAEGSSILEILRAQMPVFVADLHTSPYSDHRELVRQGINSLLSAPLMVGSRMIGTVNIGHPRPHIYTPTDLTLLYQIGSQIATGLENARLFQATQQRARYEEALGQITSRLQQQADLRDLLHRTMADLGHVLGARRARVRLQTFPGPNGAHPTLPEK